MFLQASLVQWILSIILIVSSLGVILAKKPVYSSLSFLLTLLTLAVFYIQLSAEFIGVMQVLVYAGAILVIFMFVIILFQDAHEKISLMEGKSIPALIIVSSVAFFVAFLFFGYEITSYQLPNKVLPSGHGTVESLGYTLYLNFFFPFEAVILLFLVAVIGSLYIGKKT